MQSENELKSLGQIIWSRVQENQLSTSNIAYKCKSLTWTWKVIERDLFLFEQKKHEKIIWKIEIIYK